MKSLQLHCLVLNDVRVTMTFIKKIQFIDNVYGMSAEMQQLVRVIEIKKLS